MQCPTSNFIYYMYHIQPDLNYLIGKTKLNSHNSNFIKLYK